MSNEPDMIDMVPVEDFSELAPGMSIAVDCAVCRTLHHGTIGERADAESDGPAHRFVCNTRCNPQGDVLVSAKRTVAQRRVFRWRSE